MPETSASIFSSPNFWGIIIPAVIGIIIFHLNKSAEREAEWRQEKLELYLKFIESLSGITDSEKSIEGEINFAKACNDLHAFSPNSVLKALHNYQNYMSINNTESTPEDKNIALNTLVWEMRNDLKIRPSEKKEEFKFPLWTSGKNKAEQ